MRVCRVVHGAYLSVPFPSHSNLCLSCPIPWDVSHGNDTPMDKPSVVHGTYLSVPFPPHSNLCLSHPMGRFPWDSHRNPIPMDMPASSALPWQAIRLATRLRAMLQTIERSIVFNVGQQMRYSNMKGDMAGDKPGEDSWLSPRRPGFNSRSENNL